MSYVIGIDPSITATGVCVLFSDGPPTFKTCKVKPKYPLALRLWYLQCLVASCMPAGTQPLLVSIETPISPLALGGGGGTGFNNNIMAYGEIYSLMGKFRIPYVEISPKQRAMIATGDGNASKDEVEQALPADIRVDDNNQSDAYWLAMGAAEMLAPKGFTPYGGWLELSDKAYDMLEGLEIQRP